MAKLTASKRKNLKQSQFGLPQKAKTAAGKAKPGSYPVNDKKHAALAKSFAKRFASPAERAQINAKANKVLGKSGSKKKK